MKAGAYASLVACSLILSVQVARADWYSMVMEKSPDIITVDVRWPFMPPGTYFALWNGNTAPAGGYFYGGVAISGPGKEASATDQAKASRHLVWSFWGNEQVYKGDRIRLESVGDDTYGGVMSGEGTQAGLTNGLSFIRSGRWYRMLLRTWPDSKKPDRKGYLGWWIEDVAKGQWHYMGAVSVPAKVTGVDCGAAFCEVIGPKGERVIERRLGFHRVAGKWQKADTIRGIDGSIHHFSIIENGTAFRYSNYRTPEDQAREGNVGKNELTLPNQPSTPRLGSLSIGKARAIGYSGQICLSWDVPISSAPQLAYQVDLFGKPNAQGPILASQKLASPSVRASYVESVKFAKSARLTVFDVFDQKTAIVVPVQAANPLKATAATNTHPGIRYRFYEGRATDKWQQIPNLERATSTLRGVLNEIEDSVSVGRNDPYSFRYEGFLRVPKDGIYLFSLRTCDGSRLVIDEKTVIDNDGLHSISSRFGSIALKTGLHRLRLDYFKSKGGDGGWLENKLMLSWQGPGFAMRPLKPKDLSYLRNDSLPEISLARTIGSDGSPSIAPKVSAKGCRLDRVEVFCGKLRLAVLPLSGAAPSYKALMPVGKNAVWARLWYDGFKSIDSAPIVSLDNHKVAAPWKHSVMGENNLPIGIKASDSQVSMIGDCSSYVYQSVRGDFVLTARVADISRSTKENGIADTSLIGLLCSPKDRPGGDSYEFSIWNTASMQLRGTACDRDLETSGQSRYPVGNANTHSWIRIIRRGAHFRAYASKDGKSWELAIDRMLQNLPEQLNIGVYMRIKESGKNKTLFTGTLDQISLSMPGAEIPAKPNYALSGADLVKGRIVRVFPTGEKLYARTIGNGLLASTDGRATWSPVASLRDKQIRSVAVCPSNPQKILVGGRMGLWLTQDGGETWTLSSTEVTFNSVSPSTLGGETISFDPNDPNIIVAGSESSGLFVSIDGGSKWTCTGLKDENISVVAFSPYQKDLLIVGTMGDSKRYGRIYAVRGKGTQMAIVAERIGFGLTSVAFESIVEGGAYIYFGTTHGLYYCFDLNTLFMYREVVKPDALYLAIDSLAKGQVPGRSDVFGIPYLPTAQTSLFTGRVGYFWYLDWMERKLGPEMIGVTSISADPNSGSLWLCCLSGIYKSTDAGASWMLVKKAE